MKIDLIISSLTSGGAERVVSLLANEFANRGHQVRLLTFDLRRGRVKSRKSKVEGRMKNTRFESPPLTGRCLLTVFHRRRLAVFPSS